MGITELEHCKIISVLTEEYKQRDFLTVDKAKQVSRFFNTVEGYKPTPLVSLESLAKKLKVKNIYVKDESKRMGLNAFKGIGGLYGIARILCEKLKVDINEIDWDYFFSEEVYEEIKDMVFVSATDGNHGKGIAWMADKLGVKCVIYMPKNTVSSRVNAIESLGGTVHVTDLNYDNTLRKVVEIAEENNWYHVQDQAWKDYTKIPNWISEGYMLIAHESKEQMSIDYGDTPTHIMLQAGAGSFAFGIAGYFTNAFPEAKPKITIIEPENAACYFESIQQNKYTRVNGELKTIMAGLSVGEANTEAFDMLKSVTDNYVTVPDYVTARGMRVLSSPLGNEERVISCESGSSIAIGLLSLLDHNEGNAMREGFQLNKDSVILIFNTEGDTDPEGYEHIIWDGYYSTPKETV